VVRAKDARLRLHDRDLVLDHPGRPLDRRLEYGLEPREAVLRHRAIDIDILGPQDRRHRKNEDQEGRE
jgi:hypothetical protein